MKMHTVFTVFRLLTDFVCLYNYEFGLSLCKIVRSSVILLLPLFVRLFGNFVITLIHRFWWKIITMTSIFSEHHEIHLFLWKTQVYFRASIWNKCDHWLFGNFVITLIHRFCLLHTWLSQFIYLCLS
jgi:hypothetical protein